MAMASRPNGQNPSKGFRALSIPALCAVGGLVLLSTVLVLASSTIRPSNPNSLRVWREHHERCLATAEKSYRYDRFRAIKGRVTDHDGRPVVGATVRCSRVSDLVSLASISELSPVNWIVPIVAEVRADSSGRYSFPHLSVGAYTFFYSAPGLAPAIKDLIVVQDGLGAVLDVSLEQPKTLHVRSSQASTQRQSLRLVPHRWWPELPVSATEPGTTTTEFANLGGPFRQGLIVATTDDGDSIVRVVGRYDLGESTEAVTGPSPPASLFDLAEAGGFEPWGNPPTSEQRLFYAAISPIALFWSNPPDDVPFLAAMANFVAATAHGDGTGLARGFGPQPFLPVLAESSSGLARLGWTNSASEFELSNLQAGPYRVRTLDLFGKSTFARGAFVSPKAEAKLSDGVWDKLDMEEPDAREIMGFVRWESGVPAAKATVIVQHSGNFRLFLRRVESDENGFFRVAGVPGDEPYFAFATPLGEDVSLREFVYFGVDATRREAWRDLELHAHRIVGHGPVGRLKTPMRLVRTDHGGDRVVLSFEAYASGRYSIANVTHGRYRVETSLAGGFENTRSLPVEVVEGRPEENVRWP